LGYFLNRVISGNAQGNLSHFIVSQGRLTPFFVHGAKRGLQFRFTQANAPELSGFSHK
jgi:hypothetical protein